MTHKPPYCEPAATIIRALGGTGAIADKTGISQTQVGRWRVPSGKGGTDGHIPRKYHDQLRELAKEAGTVADIPVAAFFDPEVAATVFAVAA